MSVPGSPDISVIVPVYNGEKFLNECVESILSQEGVCFEVILVDDGSTDGSRDICDRLRALDKRVRTVRIPNQGAGPARNQGMDLAVGRYFAFVDGDDLLPADALKRLYSKLRETGSELVRGQMLQIYDDSVPADARNGLESIPVPKTNLLGIELQNGKKRLSFLGAVWGGLYDGDFIRRHGVRFPAVWRVEDTMFTLALSDIVTKYSCIDEPVYVYRRHADSITLACNEQKSPGLELALQATKAIYDKLRQKYPEQDVDSVLADNIADGAIKLMMSYAADSLAFRDDNLPARIRRVVEDPFVRHCLPHYNPAGSRRKSRIIPWLMKMRMIRCLAWLCRRKAAKRFSRELEAVHRNAQSAVTAEKRA